MNKQKITFIGAGNMAYSLIGGLIENGVAAKQITAIDPNTEQLSKLEDAFGINTLQNANESLTSSDCVVLAVKPQIMRTVLEQYEGFFNTDKTVFISIAAGITSESLQKWLKPTAAIIRCMPNTPSLVQTGATVLFANSHTSDEQKQLANNILSAVGSCSWVNDENDLHAVTATSGSGPAYFFLLMEHMQAAAESLGLESEQAKELIIQTALGAAKMAQASENDLSTLRQNVTSKGGTTAAALEQFAVNDLDAIVKKALTAANDRSVEMATLFDSE